MSANLAPIFYVPGKSRNRTSPVLGLHMDGNRVYQALGYSVGATDGPDALAILGYSALLALIFGRGAKQEYAEVIGAGGRISGLFFRRSRNAVHGYALRALLLFGLRSPAFCAF